MAAPSQLQQGLLAGVGGLFGGLQRRSEADAAERMKQAYLDAQMNKQQAADAERLRRELLQEEAKSKLYSMSPEEANAALAQFGFPDVFTQRQQPSIVGAMVQGKTRKDIADRVPRAGKPSAFNESSVLSEARQQGNAAAKAVGAEGDDPSFWDATQVAAFNQAAKNTYQRAVGEYNARISAEGHPQLARPAAIGDIINVTPEVPGTGARGFAGGIFGGTPAVPEGRAVNPNLFGIPGAGAPSGNTITTKSGRTVKRVP